jgi:hypothetical protein
VISTILCLDRPLAKRLDTPGPDVENSREDNSGE